MKSDERISKLVQTVSKRVQTIQQKDINNLTIKKACQDVLDRLNRVLNPHSNNQASMRESHPEMMPINENDISSIKHSKYVNVSSITLPHMDSLCQEKLIDMYEEQTQPPTQHPHHNSMNRDEGYSNSSDKNNYDENGLFNTDVRVSQFNDSSKRSEFSFENLKPEDKEQFRNISILLNDIKPNDEHNIDKLETVLILVERANPEMVQATQTDILKRIKKIVFVIATTGKNLEMFFGVVATFLIKFNKCCLELHQYTLKAELKIMILFLSHVLGTKQIEKILESAYMTCSIDKFLIELLKLFPNIDNKYAQVIAIDKL